MSPAEVFVTMVVLTPGGQYTYKNLLSIILVRTPSEVHVSVWVLPLLVDFHFAMAILATVCYISYAVTRVVTYVTC